MKRIAGKRNYKKAVDEKGEPTAAEIAALNVKLTSAAEKIAPIYTKIYNAAKEVGIVNKLIGDALTQQRHWNNLCNDSEVGRCDTNSAAKAVTALELLETSSNELAQTIAALKLL